MVVGVILLTETGGGGRRRAGGSVHREDIGYILSFVLSYKEITLHELPGAGKKMRRLTYLFHWHLLLNIRAVIIISLSLSVDWA